MASATETISLPEIPRATRWRPSVQGWAARFGVIAAIAIGLIVLIGTLPGYWAANIALAVIYAIIGLSLNMILGYTGQVSLGHHAFVGLGAFVSAYYVTEVAGCDPDLGCQTTSLGTFLVGVGFAMASGIITAGLLGLVALRIKGLYLSLITLAYGFLALNSLFEIPFLTRGGAGMPAARPALFESDHRYVVLCLIALALVLIVDWRLLASRAGRAILSVKESEAVAASYGINVTLYKILIFMLSGATAGLAGALFAHRRTIVVAVDFTFQIALLWVLMVVVGGLGKRTGVVIGSAFFALFPYLLGAIGPLHDYLEARSRDPEEFTLLVGPLLALLTMIQFPGGIAEQISPITRWLAGEKFSMHPEGKKPKGANGHGLLTKLGIGRGGKAATAREQDDVAPGATTHDPLDANAEPSAAAEAGIHDTPDQNETHELQAAREDG